MRIKVNLHIFSNNLCHQGFRSWMWRCCRMSAWKGRVACLPRSSSPSTSVHKFSEIKFHAHTAPEPFHHRFLPHPSQFINHPTLSFIATQPNPRHTKERDKSFLNCSLVEMKAPRSFETSETKHRTQCHTPKDLNLRYHRCENFKSRLTLFTWPVLQYNGFSTSTRVSSAHFIHFRVVYTQTPSPFRLQRKVLNMLPRNNVITDLSWWQLSSARRVHSGTNSWERVSWRQTRCNISHMYRLYYDFPSWDSNGATNWLAEIITTLGVLCSNITFAGHGKH
jgi:hypothetical protein